ncbi:MAG: GNAT family N-acetyltransferase [Rhizobiaceae bacterium]|nr:GNAT family N-acetyltransferase [Rhizobiaceae bacterium]
MFLLPAYRRPEPVLAGDRVTLRLPRKGDYDEWASLRRESRAFLSPWEPRWARDELERSAWRERLRRYRHEFNIGSGIPFLIFENRGRALVGGLTLSNIRHGVAQSASIGYWIGEPYSGKGLMLEALGLVAVHAFDKLKLHRLEAACIPDNNRSVRVLEKAGFTREGLLRSYLKINGIWQDHYLYALIADGYHGASQ